MNSGLRRYVLGALGTGLFWACLFATTRLQAVEAALGRQLERMQPDGRALARGGSWWKRPRYATFGARVPYATWQRVYDVGFRIVAVD